MRRRVNSPALPCYMPAMFSLWRNKYCREIVCTNLRKLNHERGVVAGSLPRMHLKRDNTTSHAIVSLAEDAHAPSQRLPSSTARYLVLLVLRVQRDPVVEVVPAYLRCTRVIRMILVARIAAHVHAASDDEIASIFEKALHPVDRWNGCEDRPSSVGHAMLFSAPVCRIRTRRTARDWSFPIACSFKHFLRFPRIRVHHITSGVP